MIEAGSLPTPFANELHHVQVGNYLSQHIQINILYFLRLHTQVIQGLPLTAVVETYHQLRQAHAKTHSLMISPSLTQTMRTVIAREIDCLAPGFHHPGQSRDGKGIPAQPQKQIAFVVLDIAGSCSDLGQRGDSCRNATI